MSPVGREKSVTLQGALPPGQRIWQQGNLEYRVTSDPTVLETGELMITAEVRRNGEVVKLPPGAMPLLFVNPPLIHRGVEDHRAVLRQIVMDALARYV
jgi:hypothetical protein